jgi:type I restriction enzyme R subunit
MATAEALARQTIDQLLTAAGWAVQDVKQANIHAVRGVALQPPREQGHVGRSTGLNIPR